MVAKYYLTILIIIGLVLFAFPGTSYGASNSVERVESRSTTASLRTRASASWKADDAAAAAVRCPSIYIVRYGETLYSIAARCGTSAATLMRANGLRSARVWPGQRLYIPAAKRTPAPQPTPAIHRAPSP